MTSFYLSSLYVGASYMVEPYGFLSQCLEQQFLGFCPHAGGTLLAAAFYLKDVLSFFRSGPGNVPSENVHRIHSDGVNYLHLNPTPQKKKE